MKSLASDEVGSSTDVSDTLNVLLSSMGCIGVAIEGLRLLLVCIVGLSLGWRWLTDIRLVRTWVAEGVSPGLVE